MRGSTLFNVSASAQCKYVAFQYQLPDMPTLLRALSRQRVYATFPLTFQTASEALLTITQGRQTGMSAITSIPSIELINPDESSDELLQICVNIAIQHPYLSRGEVIAAGVPLQPLRKTALTLLEYLTTDGAEIVLPRSEAIDWSLLVSLIEVIVDKHCSGEVFEVNTDELLHDPVKLVKLHVILKLFGLDNQSDSLQTHLREVFETHTLTLIDVFWMYGALVRPKDVKWVPELTEMYLNMMACNILNADAMHRLHPDVRAFFLEEEGKPYHLTRLLEEHFNKYSLDRGELTTQGPVSRKRRDTVTEQTSLAVSPSNAPNAASTPISTESPIFPTRWLSIPALKQHEPEDMRASFSHGNRAKKKWDSKWDGKAKNVREMAAEREGLVSLRRKQLYPEYNDESTTYAYGMGFRYEGWCEE
ncbi:hypothetical protein N0V87_010602 [Didymella glomerata]|uniref:Uncharacterized protein n=1 Tax=Didymella glomerata TaxID=749621 RepID=A0A9W9BVT2_9PLEO|nr:hypothetical protein N0V87_010602 [Didymella glomerata]